MDFERGITRLASYARYHGHANPKAAEIWLGWRIGLWVSNLRVKYRSGRLTDAQIAAAEEIGVRFTPPYRDPKTKPLTRAEKQEDNYLERLSWLKDYYLRYGHINVPQLEGTDDWPTAGRWITRLRGSYRRGTLPQAVVHEAEQMSIRWNPGPGRRSQ
ncbi:helicase associated domain-containing protein [Brevibacterium sp. GP-SGM9]|uniref:helicase associated domain-containing protein n=1 Tax=Brevibacterium sp. GP-SGM9 TaxID=3376990 RepID=UPI0039A7791C